MRRIKLADNPGASVDLFGAGNDGYKEDTPPNPSTTVKALAMNIFQEELVRAVVNAGIALDQATTDVATHNKEQLWRALVAVSAGGAKMVFSPTEGDGAVEEIVDGIPCFTFSPGAGQKIKCAFPLADRYVVGQAMNMIFGWWANATSGNVDWDVTVELVRVGTSAVTTPADSSTPTVAAVTLDSPAKKWRVTSSEVIDSAGEVDTTAVAPSDLLLITIQRNTADTATVDAHIARDAFVPKLI